MAHVEENVKEVHIQVHDYESENENIPMEDIGTQPKSETDIMLPNGKVKKIKMSHIQMAYHSNDYKKFQKYLNREVLFETQADSCLSFLEEISRSKENKASKYISLVMKHFNVWNDEDFLRKESKQKKVLMHYVVISDIVENLLSFLIYDWANPESCNDRNYCLILKSRQFKHETGKDLLEELYDVINDEERKFYRDVCLRIIFQYFHEVDVEEKKDSKEFTRIDEFGCINQVFEITNPTYKEKILKGIVVFWIKTNSNDDIYEEYKNKIMSLEMSSESKSFFEMEFLLKEKQNIKFEKSFVKYISDARKKFGDFYKIALKADLRLLSKITERHEMFKTTEFIFQKCSNIELNSSILTSFHEVQDLKAFRITPFETKALNDFTTADNFTYAQLTEIEVLLKCSEDLVEFREFLFSRNISDERNKTLTVFEKILSTPGATDLIQLVWEKFDLNIREEILSIENPYGKFLLDYVIDSDDDLNLLTFLMPPLSDEPKFETRKYFLKAQNDQFKKITGKTLFEHNLSIYANDIHRVKKERLGTQFFLVIFTLLEEIGNIEDIVKQTPIDELLDLASDEEFYLKLNVSVEPEKLDDVMEKRVFIDDMLGNIVAYWKPSDVNFEEYKKKFLLLSPFFEMLFNIIEAKDETFERNFHDDLEKLEKSYKARYGVEERSNHYTTNFLFILLITAINNDRKKVIDKILDYETFVTVNLKFPSNMRSDEICHYVASKLLEHGHEIGKDQIPASWISAEVFKKFLDSRIKFEDGDLVEIDCSFLLHPYTRKLQVNSKADVDNKLLFLEDIDSLNYINNSESLKSFLTHPAVATYIDLKAFKHRPIYNWNFGLFLAIFVIPFSVLACIHFLLDLNNSTVKAFYIFSECLFLVSIIMLVVRECFQYKFVDKKYFGKPTNWFEVVLIIVSITTLGLFFSRNIALIDYFSVLTILCATLVLLTMLPFDSMVLHMMMLKKVIKTFAQFFLTFMFILFAFSISFCLIFGIKIDDPSKPKNNTMSDANQNETKEVIENDDDISKNFRTLPDSFLKTILMLSGEYSVEPFKINGLYQWAFFLFFVLITFILFNLIVGLTIDDVQGLRSDARRLTLKQKLKKFMEATNTCLLIYNKLRKYKKESNCFCVRHFEYALISLINHYPQFHKIDKFYVNIKTKDITFAIKQKQVSVVNAKVDEEVFDSIRKIIYKQEDEK